MSAAWRIRGGRPLSGTVTPPPDKSISHRALILGALAEGATEIENLLESADCMSTADILQALGTPMEQSADGRWTVRGQDALKPAGRDLDCGNSGTTIRLMAGVLAGQPFTSVLTGDESLRRRPMRRVVEPLRLMGAQVDGRDDGRFAPLTVRGGGLRGIRYETPVASAQVKSCILLAGLFAEGETIVTEPARSRDHTERMLAAFGIEVLQDELSCGLRGDRRPKGTKVTVPGDFSSAAFAVVAGLIVPGSRVRVEGVGLNWTRSGLLDVLQASGAQIKTENERTVAGEPIGDVVVEHSDMWGLHAGGDLVVRMIDEAPVFAVAATQASGGTELADAGELRHKESDRLETISRELRKLGAEIEVTQDGLAVGGPTRLDGAEVTSYADHRIAMSLAVAGLAADGETIVRDVECVGTSFPGFVGFMRALGADIEEI
jgi:3-phosphoshikimate 1-carboxyvinyltransferase